MRRRFLGWFAAAAVSAAAPCLAQQGELFERLDSNKDGFIAADEVQGDHKPMFERLLSRADKDSDQKLSKDEFLAGLKEAAGRGGFSPEAAGEAFDRQDANSDNKLTKDEVPEDRRERFQQMLDRLDEDGDGAVTKEQFVRVMVAMAQREGGREEGRPDRRPDGERPEGRPDRRPEGDRPGRPERGPDRPPEGRPGFPGPSPLIRALDADSDGELSADEISNASKALAKLDKNNDGKLTREELFPRPEGRPGEGPPPGPDFGQRLREADKNGDGKLSKEEAPDRLKENFDRIDTNSDGQIDEAEMRQMFERMRGRGPGGDRPGGEPRGDGEGRGERREGDRPGGDRPREDRPREDRPNRDRPNGDRPAGERERDRE